MKPKRSPVRRPSRAIKTCKDVIGLLTEYLEGDLPPNVARRLEDHLADCPSCELFLKTLRSTRSAIGNLRTRDIPVECHARLRAFLSGGPKIGRA